MSNIRFILIGLLAFTWTSASLAFDFNKPGSPTTMPMTKPITPLPVLSPDKFKQEVTQLDAQTQSKLDAAITKLLGGTPNKPPPATRETIPQQQQQATPLMTPPSAPTQSAPASTGGFNPYAN